jgi:DedD protein
MTMNAGRSGKGSTWALALVMLCIAAVGVGYYAGRNVLGEEYLKKQASVVRTARPMTPSAPVAAADPGSTVVISPLVKPREEPAEEEGDDEEAAESAEGTEETQEDEETAATATPTPVAPQTLTIQLGSFADKGNAEILVQDLRQRGVSASTQAAQQEGHSLYRVRTGTYKTRQSAEAAAEALRRKGYNAVIVPK